MRPRREIPPWLLIVAFLGTVLLVMAALSVGWVTLTQIVEGRWG